MTERDPHALSGSSPGEAPSPASSTAPIEAPPPATMRLLGLRLRVWAACLSGALVSVAAIWWIAGTQISLRSDPATLLAWLLGAGTLGIVVGIGCAMWLDHGIVVHLRGLTRGFASGRVQELRGLPAASGWGELSELTEWAAVLITRQRVASRAAGDLEQLEAAIARTVERLETWRSTERWEPLPVAEGAGAAIARELNDTFARVAELGEQNLEAARRVRAELVSAAGEARESAAQAERGFVEATALLTTVRELQRLGQELRHALDQRAEPAATPVVVAAPVLPSVSERLARYRASVESAIDELLLSSNASAEHLGAAVRRVQEVAAQVQVVSQRATLVALHAVTLESRLPRDDRREDLAHDLRLLTSEVRTASEQAEALAIGVAHEAQLAEENVRTARERVGTELARPEPEIVEAATPAPAVAAAPVESAPLSDHAIRLLERVREMIQDATQKGERLSANGERASRSADRLIRRLEEESRELEGLMVRLSPAGSDEREAAMESLVEPHPAPAELRLLDTETEAVEPPVPAASNGVDDDEEEVTVREERP